SGSSHLARVGVTGRQGGWRGDFGAAARGSSAGKAGARRDGGRRGDQPGGVVSHVGVGPAGRSSSTKPPAAGREATPGAAGGDTFVQPERAEHPRWEDGAGPEHRLDPGGRARLPRVLVLGPPGSDGRRT